MILLLALAASAPVLAQSGSGNSASGGNGSGNAGSQGSAGQGSAGQGGAGQGNAGQGNAGQGSAGQAGGAAAPGNAAAPAAGASALDVAASLQEIRSGNAMSLERVLAIASRRMRSRIIDVRLIRWNKSLVYEIKGLNAAGRIENMYLFAKSGRPVTD